MVSIMNCINNSICVVSIVIISLYTVIFQSQNPQKSSTFHDSDNSSGVRYSRSDIQQCGLAGISLPLMGAFAQDGNCANA